MMRKSSPTKSIRTPSPSAREYIDREPSQSRHPKYVSETTLDETVTALVDQSQLAAMKAKERQHAAATTMTEIRSIFADLKSAFTAASLGSSRQQVPTASSVLEATAVHTAAVTQSAAKQRTKHSAIDAADL